MKNMSNFETLYVTVFISDCLFVPYIRAYANLKTKHLSSQMTKYFRKFQLSLK